VARAQAREAAGGRCFMSCWPYTCHVCHHCGKASDRLLGFWVSAAAAVGPTGGRHRRIQRCPVTAPCTHPALLEQLTVLAGLKFISVVAARCKAMACCLVPAPAEHAGACSAPVAPVTTLALGMLQVKSIHTRTQIMALNLYHQPPPQVPPAVWRPPRCAAVARPAAAPPASYAPAHPIIHASS